MRGRLRAELRSLLPAWFVCLLLPLPAIVFWQADDDPGFEGATFRSYAPSFLRWLNATSGYLDRPPSRAMRF